LWSRKASRFACLSLGVFLLPDWLSGTAHLRDTFATLLL
jgi:hypothetical protein